MALTTSRSAEENNQNFEIQWFYFHGAPAYISADHKFCLPILQSFLYKHSITMHSIISRSFNKSGRIERNNGFLRTILYRLQKADDKFIPQVILSRAPLITKLTRGSKFMCAYQVARGFMPYVLGIPRKILT